MEDKKIQAMKFANTVRGQYIMGQALYLAIKKLESEPEPMREISNIGDMYYLMDNLFPVYRDTQKAQQAYSRYIGIASKKEKQS